MNEQINQIQFFNAWSVVHLCFWFVVAVWATARVRHLGLPRLLAYSLVGAYAWEVVEYFIAAVPVLWPLSESALNRWVSDPLMALIAVPVGWFTGRSLGRRHAHQHA